MNIDIERLRQDLTDYFGSATPIFSVAIMDVIEIQKADDYKLIGIAKSNGFNLDDYIIEPYARSLFR